jgi:hypothetical protein
MTHTVLATTTRKKNKSFVGPREFPFFPTDWPLCASLCLVSDDESIWDEIFACTKAPRPVCSVVDPLTWHSDQWLTPMIQAAHQPSSRTDDVEHCTLFRCYCC